MANDILDAVYGCLIGAAIGAEPQPLDPEMSLYDILPKFASHRVLPVLDNRQLIGMVTSESVQQSMWLNKRKGGATPRTAGESTDIA